MAHFDRFDICEAHLALENDYNRGGVLWQRPSNKRRNESTDVQLHRMRFKPALVFNGFASLSDNGKDIYTELEKRYGLHTGNVAEFEVLDHGEDGSQYFPGCGAGQFAHVATGVGDTGAEALEDALEQMVMDDHNPSESQEWEMRSGLYNPDASAFESLDHSECGEEHDGDDWNHYVSIRYNIRGED